MREMLLIQCGVVYTIRDAATNVFFYASLFYIMITMTISCQENP